MKMNELEDTKCERVHSVLDLNKDNVHLACLADMDEGLAASSGG